MTAVNKMNGVMRPPNGLRMAASEDVRRQLIPAAGNGNGSSLNNSGSNGNYWSSTPNSGNSNNAYNLNFNSGSFNLNNNNRNNGFPVRAVSDFTQAAGGGVPHRFSISPGDLLFDLYRAYKDARRHKRRKCQQMRFEMCQERELVALRDELIAGEYKARPSVCFIIHDPKMREIFAADFRDRVVHHLFYNYVHTMFERTFIADSYSCVEGRGTHYGIERLKHHINACSENYNKPCFVLRLDIKGYFMHINRELLLARCRKVMVAMRTRQSDTPGITWGEKMDYPFVDWLLEKICLLNPLADSRRFGDPSEWDRLPPDKSLFRSATGCGLPIGNLSSQMFSNVYLGAFDDFMKRTLHCRHYGRYVDDAFVVAGSREELTALITPIKAFLRDELHLELNERKCVVCDAYKGVEFLGAFVKPFRTYIASRTLRRIRGKLGAMSKQQRTERLQSRVNSLLGVLSHYDSYHLRKVMIHKAGLRQFGEMSDDGLRFYPRKFNQER